MKRISEVRSKVSPTETTGRREGKGCRFGSCRKRDPQVRGTEYFIFFRRNACDRQPIGSVTHSGPPITNLVNAMFVELQERLAFMIKLGVPGRQFQNFKILLRDEDGYNSDRIFAFTRFSRIAMFEVANKSVIV